MNIEKHRILLHDLAVDCRIDLKVKYLLMRPKKLKPGTFSSYLRLTRIARELLFNNPIFVITRFYRGHYSRSRETFYEAESLRIFARDSVPTGTFEKLKDQVYHGVVDVEEDDHGDGFKRVKAVVKTAATLNVNASGLMTVIEVKDLHGICHQLANEDLLTWRK